MTNKDIQYRFKIKGYLDDSWQNWFDGLVIIHTDDGNTILIGDIVDQAALHGVLRKIRDLGLTLISMRSQAK